MGHITLALVVVACLGLVWPTTRQLGLLCVFVLSVIHPVLVLALIPILGGAFLFINRS